MKLIALAVLLACTPPPPAVPSSRVPPPVIAHAPPLPWLDNCEAKLRAAGTALVRAGLPGPILTQRERADNWGADSYDAFITAAATNWSLFPVPPRVDPEDTDADGLVLAIGRSMKFRVVMIPIACRSHSLESEPWQDKHQFWTHGEIAALAHGVSARIRTDPEMPELAAQFIAAMKPIVDACLAERPFVPPTRECDPVPG